MDYFPAISSILSPIHLSKYLIEHYALSNETQCQVIRQGVNHTYVVTDGDSKYVFRVYCLGWRSDEEITAELELLNLLKAHDVAVSYPIKSTNGEYIQQLQAVEGQRPAVLFSYAQGASIRNPSVDVCYHLGVAMAKMHQVTTGRTANRKTYDANTLVQWAFNQATSRLSSASDSMQCFHRASNQVSEQFEKADSARLRSGIVHLDLWYDNMKIAGDSEITFFDFDNCGNGWLFLDVAYCLMLLFKNEPDKTVYEQKLRHLIEGYESICTISQEERRLMPYGALAIWLHYSGVHALRFDDFANPFFSEEFLKYWLSVASSWMEYNDIGI